MAGIQYGNLTYEPSQFDPRTQNVTFKFNHNIDYFYGELVLTEGGTPIYTAWQPIRSGTSSGDTTSWVITFEIPKGTIYSLDGDTGYHKTLYAYVRVGNELDGEHISDPQWTSSPIVVNLFIYFENDITWYDPLHPSDASITYGTSTSTCAVGARCAPRSGTGEVNSNIPNTCRFLLYNSNKVLIKTSGEILWKQGNNRYCSYTFDRLKDGQLYYVKFKIRFNGGYIYESDFNTIQVDYSPTGDYSDRLKLSNDAMHGCVIVQADAGSSAHTAVAVSRTEATVRDYLLLTKMYTSAESVEFRDYYALPGKRYVYQVVVYNGTTVVDTLYQEVIHRLSGVAIADYWGAYYAVAEVNKYPINRNDRGAYLEAMDNKYPYHIINGNTDYESGQITGIFAEVDECQIATENTEYADILREWLNNGCAKVLKYDTGEAWIVTCTGVRTEAFGDSQTTVSTAFNWTQVGDAENISHYAELGLVMNDE